MKKKPEGPRRTYEWIKKQVDRAWYCYDINRSGYLNRNETFTFLKALIVENGMTPVS